MKNSVQIFWFRRDLRLHDNQGLLRALNSCHSVLPIFVFDPEILNKLEDVEDRRVNFIYKQIESLKNQLQELGSDLLVFHASPLRAFEQLLKTYRVAGVSCNHDYEPAAISRDSEISRYLQSQEIEFKTYKDQVIFEKNEVLSQQGRAYTVFTPYKRAWLAKLTEEGLPSYPSEKKQKNFLPCKASKMPSLKTLGFQEVAFGFPSPEILPKKLKNYGQTRDFPALETGTSRLGIHLRFGTLSIRELVRVAQKTDATFLSELIWRDFFMQILFHFPHVEKRSFRPAYDQIKWRKNLAELERWKSGMTGYPLVDAGMRELKATGFMHNRVRMVCASFLCKHLLHYWYEGERHFARHLLDFDLAANNGNWQWAAGTGCDAAPYFRVFNPLSQAEKFDPEHEYIQKWIPELESGHYPPPMVEHSEARERALNAYKQGLSRGRE